MDNPDTLDLYIYDVVAPDDYNFWTDETVTSETSADFFRQKLAEYKDVKYINLYINSFGGSVKEGYGIVAELSRHPAYKTGHDDGFANSIASVIFQVCDKRIMRINSVQGIHNMMDICFGNAAEHRQCADNLDSMMEGNRQLYLQKAGGKITEEKLIELLDAESILTAKQCLEYGLCDEIVGSVANPEEMNQKMQRLTVGLAAQIKYFQQLKQSFGDAMSALAAPPKEPEPPAEPPGPEPQENRPKNLMAALFR